MRWPARLVHLQAIPACSENLGAAGDNKHLTLNERITVHLRDQSLKQSNVHAPLLPHVRMRWSADQAAIIHSIHLFDQNNGTTHHEALADRWLSTMKQRFTHQSGLFQTEVMNCKAYSKEPRGCAGAYHLLHKRLCTGNRR